MNRFMVVWLFAALVGAVDVAQATDLYWDINGTTADTGTLAAGNWDGTVQNWNTDSTGTGGTPQAGTTTSDDLTFSSGTGMTGTFTVTLTNGRQAKSLTFEEGTVTCSAGTLTFGATGTITVNSGIAALISSLLTGSSEVTKTGDGQLTLTGANTYTGGTTLNQGILVVGNGTSAGSVNGTLTVNAGATLAFARTSGTFNNTIIGSGNVENRNSALIYGGDMTAFTGTFTAKNTSRFNLNSNNSGSALAAFVVEGNVAFNANNLTVSMGELSGTNSTALVGVGGGATGDKLYVGGKNTDSTYAGQLGQTLAFYKVGSGTLTLAGANTYTGATTVSNGTLAVSGSLAAASAVTVASNATLSGSGVINGTVTANAGSTLSPGPGIATLTVKALVLNAGCTNVFELDATPTNDVIAVTVNNGLTINGGKVRLVEAVSGNDWTTPGTYTLMTYTGTVSGSVASLQMANPVVGLGYTFSLSGTALQVTILSSASVWTGGGTNDLWTTADNWGGTAPVSGAALRFNTGTRFVNTNDFAPGSSFAIEFTNSAAAFTLSGSSITLIGDLVNGSANAQTLNNDLTLGIVSRNVLATGTVTLNGVMSGGGVVKTGSGTLELTGANLYAGGTIVSAGTLKVNNSTGSGTGSGPVTIASGATLGGSGTITGAVTVAAGGTLAAGNSVGTLTAGSLTLTAGCTNIVEFSTTPANDTVVVTGGLTNNGCVVMLYTNGTTGSWSKPGTYTLFQYTGTLGGAGLAGFSVGNQVAGCSYGFTITAGVVQLNIGGSPVWSGGGTDNNWLTGGNWNGVAPAPGSTLIFNTSNQLVNSNDFAAGSAFAIVFTNGAGAFTLNGNAINLNGDVVNLSVNGQTINNDLTLTATRSLTTSSGSLTMNGAISGSYGLTKTGTGTVTLGGSNTYSGATTMSAGTLLLAGGDNRLPAGTTVTFAGNSSLDVGTTSQTMTNLTVADSTTGTVTGSGGALTINGGGVIIAGTVDNITQTLKLGTLDSFSYANAAGNFQVGKLVGTGLSGFGVVTLAATNAITASTLNVGNAYRSSTTGILHLGQSNTVFVTTITVGSGSGGTVDLRSGLTSPLVTIRDANGGTTTAMQVGQSAGGANGTGLFDLTGATVDVSVNSLNMGIANRGSTGGALQTANGTFTMNAGTFQASTVLLGQMTSATGNFAPSGSFNLNGGTAKITTLKLADKVSTLAYSIAGTFKLSGGALLQVGTITNGASGANGTITRTFNWNDGTITTTGAGTNLSISGVGLTLAATGNHTFDIGSGSTGTVNAVISGNGGLTKAGAGVVNLMVSNTYTGGTTVAAGTLRLVSSNALVQTSPVVMTGGTLDPGVYTNKFGALTVGPGASTLLIGAAPQSFTNSSALVWSGTLNLVGTLSPTALRFGMDRTGLTPAQMSMINLAGRRISLDEQGYVVLSSGTLIMVQ